MSDNKWMPNYIKRDINYKPRDILTAQEYNAILNLLISQGDYNSSWLEYLQNDAIPDAIRDLSAEVIEEVITTLVREEIAALSASVTNKTSAQLNNPMVTILNTGQAATGISLLRTLLTNKELTATYAIATNLVGSTPAYPTLAQLNTLASEGNDIVAYSTDGATMSAATAEEVAANTQEYMDINDFNTEVFVYPHGNSSTSVRDIICGIFHYAVNIITGGTIIPDGILSTSPASILGNLSVIHFDSTVDINTAKSFVDDAVQYNKYLILQIDTDSANYDAEDFEDIIDYILSKTSIVFPDSISDAMHDIHETIDNTLLALENAMQILQTNLGGITVTESEGVKYLNW